MLSDLPPIVGICGGIGSGKDTVAQWLAESFDYRPLSFAWKLKSVVNDVFHRIPAGHFFGDQADKAELIQQIGYTGREVLEAIGEAFRGVDPDVWVRYALRLADSHSPDRWVISDVRYQNEIDAIHTRGGVVWRVTKIGGRQERTGHVSDAGFETFDVDADLVAEAGDLEALRNQATQLALTSGRAGIEG